MNTDKIGFIMGCGRCGTHLLGNIIHGKDAHVCFELKLEKEIRSPHWWWVMAMARNPRIQYRWWPSLIDVYSTLQQRYAPKLFVDKTNHIYQFAEDIQKEFPEARFIGVKREMEPNVRSMMKHSGFLTDVFLSQGYDVPSEFSGAMSERYFSLSVPEKLAWRWCVSRQVLHRLRSKLYNYLVIDYEDLVYNKDETIARVEDFLDITASPIDIEDKNEGAREELIALTGVPNISEMLYNAVDLYKELHGGWDE